MLVNQEHEKSYLNKPDKVIAFLLAFFLGIFGIHKFYLGRTGWGIAYLLISVLSCFFLSPVIYVISFIESIIYISTTDDAFVRKYSKRSK